MGDINWDKMDVEKMGTPESPSRKLLDALRARRANRQAAKTAKEAVKAVTVKSGSRRREALDNAVATAIAGVRKRAKPRAAAHERKKTTT